MSFFGDMGKATKATAGAVSKGIQLLSFSAEELDKGANILVIKSECYRLETELRSLKNHQESSPEIEDVRRQLIEAYQRAQLEVGDLERKSISSKLEALLVEEGRSEIATVVARIEVQRRTLESSGDRSPASKVRSLNVLRSDYVMAASLAGKMSDKALAEDSRNRIDEIDAAMAELEKLRHAVIVDKYCSGGLKSVVRKYDGMLHGVSEYWYDGGGFLKRMSYKKGRPDGSFTLFREDGSSLVEVSIDQASSVMVQKVYLSDGSKIIDGYLSRGSGEVAVWLWNGISLGVARYSDGRISRIPFVLGLLARPKVWVALFIAYKDNDVRERFDEMSSTINEYAVFANEFSTLCTKSDFC